MKELFATQTNVEYLKINILCLVLFTFIGFLFCKWVFNKLVLSLNKTNKKEKKELLENDTNLSVSENQINIEVVENSFIGTISDKLIKTNKLDQKNKMTFLGIIIAVIIAFLMLSMLFPYKEISTYKTVELNQKLDNSNYYKYDGDKIFYIDDYKVSTLNLDEDTEVHINNQSNLNNSNTSNNQNKIEIYQRRYVPLLGNYKNKTVRVDIYSIENSKK